ncbi:uncharacterized protein LOC110612367 isoform X1 [Manihot esculenta]|uniref:MATH domain-containing protein n=1 Tax=Manihot esculenta TaxID=3983 RepID=A0A2C9WB05_MANES|nr:uncharacterized protein LOC110612367 isoform X1 [Manihot esculenta]OAY56214.1 hypothetical protein MANES_03G211000v8 [Manihot esculenta]
MSSLVPAVSDRSSQPDYEISIENLSLIGKEMEKYKSQVFEARGYKWRLVIYPNGNRSRNVTKHISVYLALADPVMLGLEVRAAFHLYLYDQDKKEFLEIKPQDAEVIKGCFHLLKHECGLDKFVPLEKYKDCRNSFSVGVKVEYVCESGTTGRGESLSMIKAGLPITHKWKIAEFSTKRKEECVESQVFTVGKHNWKIKLYPRGKGLKNNSHISLYLALADPTARVPSYKTYAQVSLRILDQCKHKHISATDKFWFSGSSSEHGWSTLISVAEFDGMKNRLVVGDVCFVEAGIYLVGEVKVL